MRIPELARLGLSDEFQSLLDRDPLSAVSFGVEQIQDRTKLTCHPISGMRVGA